MAAIQTGDQQGLFEVLAPDVVLVADGGGVVPAARRPIQGAERVIAFLAGAARVPADLETSVVWLNGALAARVDIGGEVNTAVTFEVQEGRIVRIYAIRNPGKLTRLGEEVSLSL